MFSTKFNIEDDLRSIMVSVASNISPPELGGSPLFSAVYSVEKDIRFLTHRNLISFEVKALPPRQLVQLSKELEAIEESTFEKVAKQLAFYQKEHPRSPIFSTVTLFGPIEDGRRETAVTRAIAWLIDEKQPHGFSGGVANLILSMNDKNKGKEVACVDCSIPERRTPSGQRMDVWAQGQWVGGENWLLVIEAKIDAYESENQLKHYQGAIPKEAIWTGIFLTVDGTAPTTEEAEGTWVPVSFMQLAEVLTSYYLTVEKCDGADFLRLFIAGLLRDVLEKPIPVNAAGNNRFEIADLINTTLQQVQVEK